MSAERTAMPDRSTQHRVRQTIVMPSGKSVDVNYVNTAPAAADTGSDLRFCGTCGSAAVHPLSRERAGSRFWQILLRCGSCEWSGTGVFSEHEVAVLERQLEAARDELTSDLAKLSRGNFEDEIDRFVRALAAGAITPRDFA